MIRIDSTRYRLLPSKYNPTAQAKERIVLHFTAGTTVSGAFATFASNKDRVATPYIVDRDGTVYELFDPDCWAWSLGLQGLAKQERQQIEKTCIAIELVNVGPLVRRGEKLCWWPPHNQFTTEYCSASDHELWEPCGKWRGYEAFATYTQPQIDATAELVEQLCRRFNIPKQIPPPNRRMAADVEHFRRWRGICSHQNFRADKSDIGPAFDWERLL